VYFGESGKGKSLNVLHVKTDLVLRNGKEKKKSCFLPGFPSTQKLVGVEFEEEDVEVKGQVLDPAGDVQRKGEPPHHHLAHPQIHGGEVPRKPQRPYLAIIIDQSLIPC
jgi:hypothetical protein